jgi:hypothetical protein
MVQLIGEACDAVLGWRKRSEALLPRKSRLQKRPQWFIASLSVALSDAGMVHADKHLGL